jgi:RimJ/RimL family protein N-acetyltransferase
MGQTGRDIRASATCFRADRISDTDHMEEPTPDGTLPYPDPQLRGSTFLLRPFREEDFEAAVRFGQDPQTARSVPPLPADDAATVVTLIEQFRTDGGLLHLVIADRSDDSYLGEVMVALGEHHVAELGIGVVASTRGTGMATEAFRLFTAWCMDTLAISRAQVLVAHDNRGALLIAQRAGFRREGVLRNYWDHGGTRLDVVMLSLLPGEPV